MKPGRSNDILHDFFPLFKVYRDGHIERYSPIDDVVPPGTALKFGIPITSEDISISHDPSISARIFLPQNPKQSPNQKLPLLIYIHGGGFALGSAFDPVYNGHVASLAVKSNSIAVSINYRLVPENPIQAAYDDSCVAFQWVISHVKRSGPDPLLNNYADFNKVFLVGDSAGANIAHYIASRTSLLIDQRVAKLVVLRGLMLVQPFFGGTKYDKIWSWMCPTNHGTEDPRLYPRLEDIGKIGFEKVLMVVGGGKDPARKGGWSYYEKLKSSSKWRGNAEIVEYEGVGHGFHLFDPECDSALDLMDKMVSFITQELALTSKI